MDAVLFVVCVGGRERARVAPSARFGDVVREVAEESAQDDLRAAWRATFTDAFAESGEVIVGRVTILRI